MRISHLPFAFGLLLSTLSNATFAQAQGARPPTPPAAPPPTAPPPPVAPPPAAPPAATAPAAPAAPPAPAPSPVSGTPTPTAPAGAPSAQPPLAPDAPPAVPPPPPVSPAPPAPAVMALPAQPLPPPVPAPDPATHRHDGFYLRLGLGGGFMAAKVEPPSGGLSARGGGVALELALGGTIAEGLVIGGGLYTQSASTVHWKGESLRGFLGSNTYSGDQGSIGLLAVFLDFYPNPKDGFHVQGGLGIGTLTFEKDKITGVPGETWAGGGGGALLGVGYEVWVASQWSLGGLARVLLVSGSLRGEDTDLTFDAKGYAPSLLFVATHH